jgi:hypothetical protein
MPVKRENAGAVDAFGNHVGGRFAPSDPKQMGALPQIPDDGLRWDESTIIGHALSDVDKRLGETDVASHLECIPTDIGWLVRGAVQVKTHCDECGDELNHEQIQRMIGGDEHIIVCGGCDASTDAISVRNMVVSHNDNTEWFIGNFSDALLRDISLGKTAREQDTQEHYLKGHISAPDYATLAAIGGETLIDDSETEPTRNRQGRVSPAQSIGASDQKQR